MSTFNYSVTYDTDTKRWSVNAPESEDSEYQDRHIVLQDIISDYNYILEETDEMRSWNPEDADE